MSTVSISLRTPKDLLEKVDEEAERRKRSRNYVVNEIIQKHYSNGQPEPKPAAKKAGAR
jgi:metal-responsive CopG/Arc/MetJ family transcriptional regulator